MGDIDLGVTLSAVAAVIALGAFFWEFIVVGRKQLGYRVQLDTKITTNSDPDQPSAQYANVLDLVRREDNTPLRDPSLVLVRIENSGTTNIDSGDYALANGHVGMHIHFPGRNVVGMVATEFSADFIAENFGKDSAMAKREFVDSGETVGVIDLPRTPLNRGAHFKILALLERSGERPNNEDGQFAGPRIIAGIKGGVGNGGIRKTRARTGLPVRAAIIISVFVLAIVELSRSLIFTSEPAPLDCAAGALTVTGSTAFASVVEEAAELYAKTCPGARFEFDFHGSAEGLRTLNDAGREGTGNPGVVAFSDGEKGDGLPQLLPRPTAFSLFTLVANKDTGVQDLSLAQIRQIYDGQFTNWSEIGGRDLPIRLVSRAPDSGTRKTFQQRVLAGKREPGTNSDDCKTIDPGARPDVVRCERTSTNDLLATVAQTPGTLGYSELGAATSREDIVPVRIDGHQATLDGATHRAYPFWQTEYAYTYGEPDAQSLAASFLRYLTNQVGQDVLRAHGLRPCAELENPVLCHPV